MKNSSLFLTILTVCLTSVFTLKASTNNQEVLEQNDNTQSNTISIAEQGDTVMLFTVKTVTSNGRYAPRNVFAIWITTNNDTFVKSLKVMANSYKHKLYTWNTQSGGNTTDAQTGATITSHQTHTVAWNGKNASGEEMPAGEYKVWVEFNESNFSGNPKTSVSFTKGGESQEITPANLSYFVDQVLQVFGISGIADSRRVEQSNVVVSPNPFREQATVTIKLNQPSTVNIQIFSTDGTIVHTFKNDTYSEGEHNFKWLPDLNKLQSGLYFVKVNINREVKTYKVILSK